MNYQLDKEEWSEIAALIRAVADFPWHISGVYALDAEMLGDALGAKPITSAEKLTQLASIARELICKLDM